MKLMLVILIALFLVTMLYANKTCFKIDDTTTVCIDDDTGEEEYIYTFGD
jgi:hypothetical protein